MRPALRAGVLSERPWESVGSDRFEYNWTGYLIIVDYYSQWIEVAEFREKPSGKVAKKTKWLMARYRIPLNMKTDNGPATQAGKRSPYWKNGNSATS